MKVVIDSGNSYTKLGFFEGEELKELQRFKNSDFSEKSLDLKGYSILLSSVSALDFSFLEKDNTLLRFITDMPLPISVEYESPNSLGTDRLAVAIGAQQLFPARYCVVFNAGTCLTVDVVAENGSYIGGSISPGLDMRFKALHTFTARLPLLTDNSDVLLIGKNTEAAMRSGVQNGIVAEVQGFIEEYRAMYPDCNIIITGGDADFFERKLKGSIFVVPHLVLSGLNRILDYNATT